MKKILCYIYEQMADFEITLLLHRLRNTGGYNIVSVSESCQPLTAQSGLHYRADKLINEITDITEYEALLIPGGPINNEQNSIYPIIREMLSAEKLVGAICFAPQFLGRAGVLEHYKFTTSCSKDKLLQLGEADPFNWSNYVMQRVVSDRNLITAQGYAFVDFASAVCNRLNVFANVEQEYQQLGRIKE